MLKRGYGGDMGGGHIACPPSGSLRLSQHSLCHTIICPFSKSSISTGDNGKISNPQPLSQRGCVQPILGHNAGCKIRIPLGSAWAVVMGILSVSVILTRDFDAVQNK